MVIKNQWTEEQIKWLVTNYSNLGAKECAVHLNRTEYSVEAKATRLKLKLNPNLLKSLKKQMYESIFERKRLKKDIFIQTTNWNKFINLTDETVYLLGYMWADGHLHKDKWDNYHINLTIQQEDGEAIKDYFSQFGYSKKFKYKIYKSKRLNEKPLMYFTLGDWKLGYWFKVYDYDIKSFSQPTKILSIIPENKKHLFFLGYSDGDGTIRYDEYHFNWGIFSQGGQNWNFLKELFDNLSLQHRIYIDSRSGTTSGFWARSRMDSLKWCNYMYQSYKENKIGLTRKAEKYFKECERQEKSLRPL